MQLSQSENLIAHTKRHTESIIDKRNLLLLVSPVNYASIRSWYVLWSSTWEWFWKDLCRWQKNRPVVQSRQNWPISFNRPDLQHQLTINFHLTLKMTFAQVVKTSATNESSFQNQHRPKDHTEWTTHVMGSNHLQSHSPLTYIILNRIFKQRNQECSTQIHAEWNTY